LEQVKQQVDTFEAQKKILTQRVATIEQLQRDRPGGTEYWTRSPATSFTNGKPVADNDDQKGNNLSMEGAAASVNSVVISLQR